MTLREWIHVLETQQQLLLLFFGALPGLALLGFAIPRLKRPRNPARWGYSLLVHLACLPGMFSLALVVYSLFFSRENLLDASLMVYFLPLLSMGLTLTLVSRQVAFANLPGFDRLAGLMGLMGLTFLGVLLLSKLFVGVFFGGSILQLLGLGVLAYFAVQWCWRRLFGQQQVARRLY